MTDAFLAVAAEQLDKLKDVPPPDFGSLRVGNSSTNASSAQHCTSDMPLLVCRIGTGGSTTCSGGGRSRQRERARRWRPAAAPM